MLDPAPLVHHGMGFEKDVFTTAGKGLPRAAGLVIGFHSTVFCKIVATVCVPKAGAQAASINEA